MIDIDPKLLKIIALAREGIGGEKENAIDIVKQICKSQDLDFDDVMQSTDEKEYMLDVGPKNKFECDIVAQVCWRFAITDNHPGLKWNKREKVFFYTTTPGRHIETVNAANVYLKSFRKERNKFTEDLVAAFVSKHKLYSQLTKKDDNVVDVPPPSDPSRVFRLMALRDGMDEVTIQKALERGE